MQLTFIGAILFVVAGGIFVRGSTLALFALLLGCSVMGGSAAMILPAIGGASIAPVQFVLPFLVARIVLAGRAELPRLAEALKANVALVVFAGYGVVAAIAAPRIFARAMNVVPLRLQNSGYLFETMPLGPTNQNVTTSVYMVGTLLLALCAYVTMTREGAARILVRTAIFIVWVHVFLGVSDVLLGATAYGEFLALFRNATYAQLEQSYGSFIRIKGIFPEASAYAGFGFAWFVFTCECWFRGVRPRATGTAALAMLLVLLFSTSGTAYVALAGYGTLVVLRTFIAPQSLTANHIVAIAIVLLTASVAVAGAMVLLPGFAAEFGTMIGHMTVDKGASDSGLQRLFWARKGFEAFRVSHGLGIGPGSFRSSSLLTAILGASGVVGIAAFAVHVVRVFKPLRASTYVGSRDERVAIGVAASWALLAVLVPASISAPSPDPGTNFAVFSGCALALRRRSSAARRAPAGALHGAGTALPRPITSLISRTSTRRRVAPSAGSSTAA